MSPIVEIALHELRAALRTRRLVVTALLFVVIGTLAAAGYFFALRQAQQIAVETLMSNGVPEIAAWEALRSQSDEIAIAVFDRVGPGWDNYAAPLRLAYVVPVFLLIALTGIPWMVAGASFDLFASDLRSRTLCYWSMRVPRRTLVIARICSQIVVIAGAILVVGVITTLLGGLLVHDFSIARALAGFGYATALVLPPAAAYVAIVAFASSMTRSPLGAGALAVGMLIALAMLRIPQLIFDESSSLALLRHVRIASPGWWSDGLWSSSPTTLLATVAAYLGFAAIFSGLAAWMLGRHDL